MHDRISDLIHSSRHSDDSDDALKDEDNVGWVMREPAYERARWLTALEWVRLADRLAEAEGLHDGQGTSASPFTDFMRDWRRLREGHVPPESPFRSLFERLQRQWREESLSEEALQVWDLYLGSLWRYRNPGAVIKTFEDYREALYCLSGTFFQALPFQPPGLAAAVGALGTLDQFYNNLRDLHEDTQRGLCYFPDELLADFSIARTEFGELIGRADERLVRLYERLFATFVPELRQRAAPLLSASGLPPSWRRMLSNFLTRYSRIEYVARLVDFNAGRFHSVYWTLTRADLAGQADRLTAAGVAPPG